MHIRSQRGGENDARLRCMHATSANHTVPSQRRTATGTAVGGVDITTWDARCHHDGHISGNGPGNGSGKLIGDIARPQAFYDNAACTGGDCRIQQ